MATLILFGAVWACAAVTTPASSSPASVTTANGRAAATIRAIILFPPDAGATLHWRGH
jgi:hypothetical protein